MKVYCSEEQTRVKIVPQKIEYEVSEIKVLPRVRGREVHGEPVTVKVDPPIDGEALEALLTAEDLEIEDGKLVSFK